MSIYDNILENMSEGLMTIGFDGVITHANPAAVKILELTDVKVVGAKFAALFFDDPGRDEFVQTILEAIYDKEVAHHSIVPYDTSNGRLHLRVMTSFYSEQDEKKGIIVVFSDLSELMELRDSIKSMERIQALNQKLEMRNQLLSETFGRFLSDEIVKQLLDTPGGLSLGGRKRSISIMMSDLRGFTAMSERMEATELISMLNHYLGAMTEVIQKHRGTIIEFIGDGIMAVFGAPTYSKSHASDAVAAALAMQQEMDDVNSWNERLGYPKLEMGIGINTGEVIVGNIGSDKRTKYGVVGSHVNLCGRIESYTVGGSVLIPPATKAACASELEVAEVMKVRPKGVEGDLELYRIVGIGDPYNLHIETEKVEPVPLKERIPVSFRMLEGKHGTDTCLEGEICALCENGAVLFADSAIEVFDNLQLDCGGKLFVKVIGKKEEGFLLRFTAVPESFEGWISEKGIEYR